jgi:hypothetical protein
MISDDHYLFKIKESKAVFKMDKRSASITRRSSHTKITCGHSTVIIYALESCKHAQTSSLKCPKTTSAKYKREQRSHRIAEPLMNTNSLFLQIASHTLRGILRMMT